MGRYMVALAVFLATASCQGQVLVDTFGTGTTAPTGWVLRDGSGSWDPAVAGKRTISVRGAGDDMSYWARTLPWLRPNTTYSVRFRAKAAPGTSTYTLIGGLDVCNRDFATSTTEQTYGFTFTTPDDVSNAFLRLGQWHMSGSVAFSEVRLIPVTPVHGEIGGSTLGDGESIHDGVYTFHAEFSGDASNTSRCLARHTAPFNSNRWVFTGGANVIYRHAVGAHAQTQARLGLNVNYHTGGACVVSFSTDGKTWQSAARLSTIGVASVTVPAALLPAREIWVKLEGESAADAAGNSAPGAFQIDTYTYEAQLEGLPADAIGRTAYVQVLRQSPSAQVALDDVGGLRRGSGGALRATVTARSASLGEIVASATISGVGARVEQFYTTTRLATNRPTRISIPYTWRRTGPVRLRFTLARVEAKKGEPPLYEAVIEDTVPYYFASDYGHSLTPTPDGELWWCEAPYKVSPDRLPPPQAYAAGLADLQAVRGKGAIALSAAPREREHAQLVFRPLQSPGPVEVAVSALRGPRGARLGASALEVREVAYVRITTPTDRIGVAGEWPDPLPPLEGAWKPRPGRNNVLWLTVDVPASAPAGDYAGLLTLKSGRWRREIDVKLRVRSFPLPAMTSLRSGFGVLPHNIARYHNLRSPGSLEKVWDLYMEAFRKRRIAPYNPMALAPYQVAIEGARWLGGIRDASTAGSGAASLRIDDGNPAGDVSAACTDLIRVQPGAHYTLRWKCRTGAQGQGYLLTVGHYDANRQWMSGRNNDIGRIGSGDWQSEIEEVGGRIPGDARFVNVVLRPTVWTEGGENTGSAWFDDIELLAEGSDDNLLGDGGFETPQQLSVRMDFADFDKAARRYLDGFGFNAFTIGIQGLPGGRHPTFDYGSFMGYPPDSPEYDALMTQYGRMLEDHLQANGWLSKAYVYWYDEPEEADYPIVQEGAARLKRYFPRLKRMMTEQFEKPLFGSVDLWCPITPAYSESPARERQKLGEEVWWYVCTGPKEPYCTLFIDHPAVELRTWLWQTWQRGLQGILIWETTWWTSPFQFAGPDVQNPWEDPQSYVGAPTGVWGNGDGRFYYPPNRRPNEDRTTEYLGGPVDSLRWEMLGDGIEDWEYFRILEAAVRKAESVGRRDAVLRSARALLVVPKAVTTDLTKFSHDPGPMLRHREAVAQAIEQLRGGTAAK